MVKPNVPCFFFEFENKEQHWTNLMDLMEWQYVYGICIWNLK